MQHGWYVEKCSQKNWETMQMTGKWCRADVLKATDTLRNGRSSLNPVETEYFQLYMKDIWPYIISAQVYDKGPEGFGVEYIPHTQDLSSSATGLVENQHCERHARQTQSPGFLVMSESCCDSGPLTFQAVQIPNVQQPAPVWVDQNDEQTFHKMWVVAASLLSYNILLLYHNAFWYHTVSVSTDTNYYIQ